MGAHGITLAEEGHFVTLFAPDAWSSAASSEVFSMENWSHATIIVSKGAGSAVTIILENCTAFAGTGAATMAFDYYTETTAAGDTLSARTAATTAGVALDTDTGTLLIIEIDDDELPDGSPYVRIKHDAAGAIDFGAMAVLTGGRIQQSEGLTAIA